MSERDYAKSIVDIIPEEHLSQYDFQILCAIYNLFMRITG